MQKITRRSQLEPGNRYLLSYGSSFLLLAIFVGLYEKGEYERYGFSHEGWIEPGRVIFKKDKVLLAPHEPREYLTPQFNDWISKGDGPSVIKAIFEDLVDRGFIA